MVQAMILPGKTHFNDKFYISRDINKIQIANSLSQGNFHLPVLFYIWLNLFKYSLLCVLGECQITGYFITLEILAMKVIMYVFPIEINTIHEKNFL